MTSHRNLYLLLTQTGRFEILPKFRYLGAGRELQI